VTKLEEIPQKLSGVQRDAEVVIAVASGIANQSPGLEIVRRDPADAPFIYNTDHYTVIENLTGHPEYLTFVRRAGVQDSIELRSAIDLWVWILGPTRDRAVHWSKEIPGYIRDAKEKANVMEPSPTSPAAPDGGSR
jgi:hypothetical protein